MRGDHALVEDDAALGVDAGGDIGGRHLARRGAQLGGILRLGQRVQVDDAEDALVVVLQRDPVADRAEIIAEMQIAGRLDAGKNAVHWISDAAAVAAPVIAAARRAVKPVAGATGPRRSRQSATPRPSASSAEDGEPGADQRRRARRAASTAARQAPERAAIRSSASTTPMPSAAAAIRGRLRRARGGRGGNGRAGRSSTSRVSACTQPATLTSRGRCRHAPGTASAASVRPRLVAIAAIATLTGVAVSWRAKKAGASTLTRTKAGRPAA